MDVSDVKHNKTSTHAKFMYDGKMENCGKLKSSAFNRLESVLGQLNPKDVGDVKQTANVAVSKNKRRKSTNVTDRPTMAVSSFTAPAGPDFLKVYKPCNKRKQADVAVRDIANPDVIKSKASEKESETSRSCCSEAPVSLDDLFYPFDLPALSCSRDTFGLPKDGNNDTEPRVAVVSSQKKRNNKQNKEKKINNQCDDQETYKYWHQRYRLFTRFDEGIKLDRGLCLCIYKPIL